MIIKKNFAIKISWILQPDITVIQETVNIHTTRNKMHYAAHNGIWKIQKIEQFLEELNKLGINIPKSLSKTVLK